MLKIRRASSNVMGIIELPLPESDSAWRLPSEELQQYFFEIVAMFTYFYQIGDSHHGRPMKPFFQ